MKILNCSLNEAEEKFKGRRIVIFGSGSWLKQFEYSEFERLKAQFAYIIDNNPKESIELCGIVLKVYTPRKVMEEKDCIIVLSSPVYQYEMYCQLIEMKLCDDILCYSFPFMQLITEDVSDSRLLKILNNQNEKKIPKIIHGFWFSGEKKTELYQKCFESWHTVLTNYKIIEWNMENYDWHKHPFVERAIECKAWAFASDYARLDVLKEFGGFYLDMDVEVFKTFDNLLGNNAILAFTNHVLIDLAVAASTPENKLIDAMLKLYDTIPIPNSKSEFTKLHQPSLIRSLLAEWGIRMDGSLQMIEDLVTVYPKEYFMPLDHILFRDFKMSSNTYCVHYDNFGWGADNNSSTRQKKIVDNRKLWRLISYDN